LPRVVEAFSCGLPVIASNLGGLADIVRDGITGLCVRNNNADDLAEKVRWAISHPSEMQEMGRNARIEYEERFSPDRDHAELMNIYHSMIRSH
jgi:glycosyltransferase involved in cell wall biosynthesis